MQEVLHHRGNYLVRRQRLAPGEASPWHRDPYHRVTVVLSGDRLNIEFRDGSETLSWDVTVGEVDWSEPSDRVHRAVNVGKVPFEEVVTFFLDRPDADPQPEEDLSNGRAGPIPLRSPTSIGARAKEVRHTARPLSSPTRFECLARTARGCVLRNPVTTTG